MLFRSGRCDGVDSDCDGEDLPNRHDCDGDEVVGELDCDDFDPYRNARTAEVCGDGRDQNCDGVDPVCKPFECGDGFRSLILLPLLGLARRRA